VTLASLSPLLRDVFSYQKEKAERAEHDRIRKEYEERMRRDRDRMEDERTKARVRRAERMRQEQRGANGNPATSATNQSSKSKKGRAAKARANREKGSSSKQGGGLEGHEEGAEPPGLDASKEPKGWQDRGLSDAMLESINPLACALRAGLDDRVREIIMFVQCPCADCPIDDDGNTVLHYAVRGACSHMCAVPRALHLALDCTRALCSALDSLLSACVFSCAQVLCGVVHDTCVRGLFDKEGLRVGIVLFWLTKVACSGWMVVVVL
jgi:hypothetical protein